MGSVLTVTITDNSSIALDCSWSGGTIQNIVGPGSFHLAAGGGSQVIGWEKDDGFQGGGFTRSADVEVTFSVKGRHQSVQGPVTMTWHSAWLFQITVTYHCGALWNQWVCSGTRVTMPVFPVPPSITIPTAVPTQPANNVCTCDIR